MSLEDAAVERLYGWLSNLEAALVNERKTSADRKIKEQTISLEETRAQDSWRSPKRSRERARRWPQKSTLRRLDREKERCSRSYRQAVNYAGSCVD